jgi:hypothetical protein
MTADADRSRNSESGSCILSLLLDSDCNGLSRSPKLIGRVEGVRGCLGGCDCLAPAAHGSNDVDEVVGVAAYGPG